MYSKSCNDWYVPITCARPKISPDAIIAKVLFMNIFLIVFLYINSSTIEVRDDYLYVRYVVVDSNCEYEYKIEMSDI